jgi:large subunit ribosomal protein L29
MKAKEWRDLGLQEVETKMDQLRSELFTARIRKETGQLENTAKLRTLRRDIARAETILREKQVSRSEPKASEGQR